MFSTLHYLVKITMLNGIKDEELEDCLGVTKCQLQRGTLLVKFWQVHLGMVE